MSSSCSSSSSSSSSSSPPPPVPTYSTLVLSRPSPHVLHVEISVGKVNAMNRAFWTEFRSCFVWVSSDSWTRAVIVSARGRIFSAGLDLADHTDLLGNNPAPAPAPAPASGQTEQQKHKDTARAALHRRQHVLLYQSTFTAIERCPQPVIAAVHSSCIGGAIDLITACDIRICTQDANFSIKEVDVGLAADVGTLQRIGHVTGNSSLVRELVYTARSFIATEAMQMGLVSRIYPTRDDMLKAAHTLANTIASKSPVAVYGSKVMLNYARDHTVTDALEYVATWNGAALDTHDIVESFTASINKTKPIYSHL